MLFRSTAASDAGQINNAPAGNASVGTAPAVAAQGAQGSVRPAASTGAHAVAGTATIPIRSPAEAVSVPRALQSIDGLDTVLGQRYCAGRADVFLRALRQFVTHYRGGIGQIDAQIEAGDLTAARNVAHSLKGASGALGAVRVQSLALTLESALMAGHAPELLREASSALQNALSALVDEIDRHLPVDGVPIEALPDAATQAAHLDRLEALLTAADFRAGAHYRALASWMRALHGDALQGFERALQAYDYVTALNALRALRADADDAAH